MLTEIRTHALVVLLLVFAGVAGLARGCAARFALGSATINWRHRRPMLRRCVFASGLLGAAGSNGLTFTRVGSLPKNNFPTSGVAILRVRVAAIVADMATAGFCTSKRSAAASQLVSASFLDLTFGERECLGVNMLCDKREPGDYNPNCDDEFAHCSLLGCWTDHRWSRALPPKLRPPFGQLVWPACCVQVGPGGGS